ncbi:MAG: AraC family transcriptional regulator [Rikenellaceae bacterium]
MFHSYIDSSGILKERYSQARRVEGYAFVLCARGECVVNIYMSEYHIKKNSVITLLPNSYFKIVEQSDDAELYVATFRQSTIGSKDLHSTVFNYIAHIIEFPVVEFTQRATDIMRDYVKLLMRMEELPEVSTNYEFVSSTLKQFILLIGTKRQKVEEKALVSDRSKAIVMDAIKLIATNYACQRGLAFYARQMHISPQHLSTIVRKVLGLTITDLIAQFVIIDAETQLTSTSRSIKEICSELNFDDISTFGKYFKRYTTLSPRKYRSEKTLSKATLQRK